MVTGEKLHKFLRSLQGHSDKNFTIEEVRRLENHYELSASLTSLRDPAQRNPLGETEFMLVHIEAENALRIGLAFFLEVPGSRLAEVEEAIKTYSPLDSTLAYLSKVFDGEDDISFNVSMSLVLPRVINRDTRNVLQARIMATFAVLYIEWEKVARHIAKSLGLPEDHGLPTKH